MFELVLPQINDVLYAVNAERSLLIVFHTPLYFAFWFGDYPKRPDALVHLACREAIDWLHADIGNGIDSRDL